MLISSDKKFIETPFTSEAELEKVVEAHHEDIFGSLSISLPKQLVKTLRKGLAKHFPHCMRHGFATRMLFDTETIGEIYTVSKLLGHSRVSTTEVYLHLNRTQLEESMLADPLGQGV